MMIYCAKCEAANSDQAPFCGQCFHPLKAITPLVPAFEPTTKPASLIDRAAISPDNDDPAPQFRSEEPQAMTCVNCGKDVPETGTVCPYCRCYKKMSRESKHGLIGLFILVIIVVLVVVAYFREQRMMLLEAAEALY